ncbi:MAG: endolytic transglycosylase MltG [Oscillospiraceae bacterium]
MKRLISSLLILTLCFSFFGCVGKNEKPQPTQKPSVKITFPEGYNVLQVAQLLEKNKVCSANEFLELTKKAPANFPLVAELKNPQNRIFLLEGYIFPDTYDFYVGEGAQNALLRFLKNASSKITKEDLSRATELGYTMDEIITLASIIQSEAGNPAEMKKVSSVFHNRINSSYKKLESDVTILYIKDKLSSVITDQAQRDAYYKLYSTYELAGLPAGAVCNPGRAAITAALYPDQTEYFFFVTDKNSGSYYYAKTFAEHKKNCQLAGW